VDIAGNANDDTLKEDDEIQKLRREVNDKGLNAT
jgi:hypothetical protein